MKEFWDSRYGDAELAYGNEPNEYFKKQLLKYKPGQILLPAEGEGRNAVFAAKLGWEVSAFDLSKEGKAKAEKLAIENNVEIDYQVGEFSEIKYAENQFDAIGLIYAHFPAETKSAYHKILDSYLRKGGIIIFEAFSKSHLKFNSINHNAGGPKNIDMLFSTEELKSDFSNYEIIELIEEEVILKEGLYHNGQSSVIRFVGRKK
jgi:cyclopropane fatty-acyl-phospholipid synthase-like methyltransferase